MSGVRAIVCNESGDPGIGVLDLALALCVEGPILPVRMLTNKGIHVRLIVILIHIQEPESSLGFVCIYSLFPLKNILREGCSPRYLYDTVDAIS